MPKLIKAICLLSFLIISQFSFAQSYTSNKGKEFWIGYGHHQSMETSTQNFQNLSLYLSVDSLPSNVPYVTVTITIVVVLVV